MTFEDNFIVIKNAINKSAGRAMFKPQQAKKQQSILGLIPLFKVIEEQGKDPEELLRRRGLSLAKMSGAAVIDQNLELEIVSDAIEMLDDPILGIKVGNQVTFTSYGSYAMLLMSAPTFLETLKVGEQFQSLSLLFSHMTVHLEQDFVELRYTLPEGKPTLKHFIADRDLMGTYIFVRELMEQPKDYFLGAGTARPKPTGRALKVYQQYIDFDLQFDQAYNWIRLPRAVLNLPPKYGNHLAHQLYKVQAYELLRKFYTDSEDVVAQTQQIIEGYDTHYPTVPEVANMFGVSDRTYRRKLDDAKTSYRALLDAHKRNRCLAMLSQKNIAVSELADVLGYAESASFLRAFKRWTGTTPKRYKSGTM
ncbi:MAG: AraC-like DNA-binding protein [Oleiphilaceae bacterium]|jgi:AraC-like DNA-binding protein